MESLILLKTDHFHFANHIVQSGKLPLDLEALMNQSLYCYLFPVPDVVEGFLLVETEVDAGFNRSLFTASL